MTGLFTVRFGAHRPTVIPVDNNIPETTMFSFDPYSPAIDADPFPYYKHLRDDAPCFWSPEAQMWVLSRYADIVTAGQDWQTYSSASGNLMTELPGRAGATLGTSDPPKHDRLRGHAAGRVWVDLKCPKLHLLDPVIRSSGCHWHLNRFASPALQSRCQRSVTTPTSGLQGSRSRGHHRASACSRERDPRRWRENKDRS